MKDFHNRIKTNLYLYFCSNIDNKYYEFPNYRINMSIIKSLSAKTI